MRRRLKPIALIALAVVGVAANAVAGGSPRAAQYKLPEPAVTASSTLRLPSLHRCIKGSSVRVTLVPPAGVTFASLSVRVGADEILQLAGLTGPGSVKVTLPLRRVRVQASG